jgi:tetratricopeptide (TPR) repeat protein
MNTIADQYYFKAKGLYPYNLEEILENLRYALSYDDEHIGANALMAQVYTDDLVDYDQAEEYYQRAMAADPTNVEVCLEYTRLLIIKKEFDKAERLIDHIKGFKAVDLARLYYYEGLRNEYQQKYEKALPYYDEALLEAYNEPFMHYLNEAIERVKAKIRVKARMTPVKRKEASPKATKYRRLFG